MQGEKAIRKLCANCDHGNCLLLDDGDVCVCPQLISYSLPLFAAVLPADKELYAEIMNNTAGKRCSSAAVFIPSGNRAQYCDSCKKKWSGARPERVQRYRVTGNGLEAEKHTARP